MHKTPSSPPTEGDSSIREEDHGHPTNNGVRKRQRTEQQQQQQQQHLPIHQQHLAQLSSLPSVSNFESAVTRVQQASLARTTSIEDNATSSFLQPPTATSQETLPSATTTTTTTPPPTTSILNTTAPFLPSPLSFPSSLSPRPFLPPLSTLSFPRSILQEDGQADFYPQSQLRQHQLQQQLYQHHQSLQQAQQQQLHEIEQQIRQRQSVLQDVQQVQSQLLQPLPQPVTATRTASETPPSSTATTAPPSFSYAFLPSYTFSPTASPPRTPLPSPTLSPRPFELPLIPSASLPSSPSTSSSTPPLPNWTLLGPTATPSPSPSSLRRSSSSSTISASTVSTSPSSPSSVSALLLASPPGGDSINFPLSDPSRGVLQRITPRAQTTAATSTTTVTSSTAAVTATTAVTETLTTTTTTTTATTPPTPGAGDRFELHIQPNKKQRKSYPHENRSVKPSPLIIQEKSIQDPLAPPIVSGTVSVRLVTKDCEDLPANRQNILMNVDGEGLSTTLTATNRASFYLKITQTSEGAKYRLAFTLKYRVQGSDQEHEEQLFSEPFIVYSNKGNRKIDKPKAAPKQT